MMNVQSISKVEETSDPKPNPTKPGNDQGKIINQLRQEIKKLNNTIKEMQRKPDIQAINIAIPRKLLSKVNRFILDYEKNTGELINISDLFCDAIDVYLWAEEENKLLEEERRQAESEGRDKT